MTDIDIENLVLEGGGVRGIAFSGAIKYLEEKNLLHKIKRFAGSSAGAMAALLLAIGLNSIEFKELLNSTDFSSFKDASTGCQPFSFIRNGLRFVLSYSWHKGDTLEKSIGKTLEEITGSRDITFKEIYEKYGKELIITATNVDKARTIYFHHHSYPDLPVRIAVRASMAIPLYFKPVKLDGEYLVDGGFLNNYPIWIFDNCDKFPCDSGECDECLNDDIKPNPKTLGLKLVGPDEKQDELLFHGKLNTTRVRHYIFSLIDCMGWQIERSGIKPGYWERTVIIPTFDIKTTDFDLSESDKDRLNNSGYQSARKFLETLENSQQSLNIDLNNQPYFLHNINGLGKIFNPGKVNGNKNPSTKKRKRIRR